MKPRGFQSIAFNGTYVLVDSPDLDAEIPDAKNKFYVVPRDVWLEYERLFYILDRYAPKENR